MKKMIRDIAVDAKKASLDLRKASSEQKNRAIQTIAQALIQDKAEILKANQADIEEAREAGLSEVLIDRLSLDGRLDRIIEDVRAIESLPDPVGEVIEEKTLPNGLKVSKRRVPLGVIGVIYESRPNVTVDVAVLCIKTGNAVILRGGKETLRTNVKLVAAIQKGLRAAGISSNSIQLIDSADRVQVKELLKMHEWVDLIIPRGGAQLHQFCRENSTIPVITGGIGICHLFIDESADLDRAIAVVDNAKTQRPTVCNALDTLLVHRKIADAFLPKLAMALLKKQVAFRLDEGSWRILASQIDKTPHSFQKAVQEDWQTEWLRLILGIKIVENCEEAIIHIQNYGSGHSDGILTQTKIHADAFVNGVDSSTVYVNASTRFTDGGEMGLGAEVAISTQKLHARGPMGLRELTSYKWIVEGNYHTRR